MQALSDAGAKVLHAEAVEWARRAGIEIRCVATHKPGGGTAIRKGSGEEFLAARVAAITMQRARITLIGERAPDAALAHCLTRFAVTGATLESSLGTPGTLRLTLPLQEIHDLEGLLGALEESAGPLKREEELEALCLVGRRLLAGGFVGKALDELSRYQLVPQAQSWGAHQVSFLFTEEVAKKARTVLFERFLASPSVR